MLYKLIFLLFFSWTMANRMPKLKWRHLPYASHGLPVRLPEKPCPDCQRPMAQHFCSCVYRPV